MVDLILYAMPAFAVLVLVEFIMLRRINHDPEHGPIPPDGPVGYQFTDSMTSVSMGLVSRTIASVWHLGELAAYAALYQLTPLRMPADQWYTYALLFILDDLVFYVYHRTHHEIRVLWAQHVVHHSSRHFNLTTAVRQQWLLMTELPYWCLLALLGFQPWMILSMHAANLIYQFSLHTEAVRRMPRWIEAVFNTPSHHRVHHGSNPQYLDRNYGGVLILWDRLFGTFEPEGERVIYGLTKNIHTFHPVKVFGHEWVSIWRDARRAETWRARLGYVFRGPGWTPAGQDRRELEREEVVTMSRERCENQDTHGIPDHRLEESAAPAHAQPADAGRDFRRHRRRRRAHEPRDRVPGQLGAHLHRAWHRHDRDPDRQPKPDAAAVRPKLDR